MKSATDFAKIQTLNKRLCNVLEIKARAWDSSRKLSTLYSQEILGKMLQAVAYNQLVPEELVA